MEFGDQLPCGGYEQQDKTIEKNLQKLSLQADGKQTKQCQKSCENCDCNKNCNKVQEKQEQQIKPAKKQIVCKKCKNNQAVLSHKNQVICKQCLMKNIQYKTRLTLENKIKVKGKSKILICVSGGLNSICLVNILNNIKKRYQKNPLFGQLSCIHIQQQTNLPNNYVQKFQEATGLILNVIPISNVYQDKEIRYQDIVKLFKQMPKSSNSIDLLNIFRDYLILNFAQEKQFDFIMTGKNGQSLASQMFKYFTKGIGGSSGQLCANEKSPFEYPLRQHLQKQLQYYFYTEKLGNLAMIAQQDDLQNNVSDDLDSILNNFITNLQDRYSHTAPAIVRTGEKLKRKSTENIKRCKWCFLDHSQPTQICQKCFRLKQSLKGKTIVEKLPKWMNI